MTLAAVKAAEADWVAALETRDLQKLACRLAPDFIDTTWRGQRILRQDMLSALPARPNTRIEITDLDAQQFEQTGVVRGLNTQRGADGAVTGQVRFTDLLVYRDGRWQAVAAQETVVQP